ncbi:MAG: ribosome assembly cofactor RimP [Bacteroidales bacterium]|nr:ribosome assembly cofactor RimP [Bacteroidales bacterium]
MISKKRVVELIEERIEGTDIFIVNVDISTGNKILITLDADQGLSIEKCMSVSRNVEHNLDREEEDFSLEVASSGLNNPLLLPRQFEKYIGKKIVVQTNDMDKLEGILLAFDDKSLDLELELSKKQKKAKVEPKMNISFDEIKETKAAIRFK